MSRLMASCGWAVVLAWAVAATPAIADQVVADQVVADRAIAKQPVCVVDDRGVAVLAATVDAGGVTCTTDSSGCCDLEKPLGVGFSVRLGDVEPGLRVLEAGPRRIVLAISTTFDEVLVRAASRHPERVVEAPAQVAVVGPEDLERRGAFGQAPRLLGVAPGVELAQGGLWDYNLNVRGFGGSTNRRVLTLVDGRDPSQAVFSGALEWAGMPLDDLESAELVYGPSAALYGAGAFNAVLDLRTKPARKTLGREVRLGLGERDFASLGARLGVHSGRWGDLRLVGSLEESDDFVQSRTSGGEYPNLPAEVVEPSEAPVRIGSLGLRWDRELRLGVATIEAATAWAEATTVTTGLGRLERERVEKPWVRAAFESPRLALLASQTERQSDAELSLASGSAIVLDEARSALEVQANQDLWSGRALLVGGVSWTRLAVDSADRFGVQTLFDAPVSSSHEAAYAQGQFDLGARTRVVGSLRWDNSDLHDARLSPRLAVVVGLSEVSALRLSWGEGFQSPTLSEKYLRLAVAPPLDLSGIESIFSTQLGGGGTSLGLGAVPLLAVGNPALDTENNETLELGWTGVVGDSLALQATVWRARLRNFTSNLLPVVGTSVGTLGSYDPWRAPSTLDPALARTIEAVVGSALQGLYLARDAEGRPYVPLLSFASFGQVDTEGAELGATWARGPWRVEASGSYFDAEVKAAVAEIPLSPNRPRYQAAFGLGWLGEDLTLNLDVRWNEAFDYRSGVFVGPVDEATLFDGAARWALTPAVGVELAVTNLFDTRHAESFGGDLLRRRGLARLVVRW